MKMKKNTTDQDIEKAKAEPKAANYSMTREEADEFFRSIGQSLEDKITKGFTEEGAINQASLLKQQMSETPEQSHQRDSINKDHDDIYDDAFFLKESLKKSDK